MPHDFRRQGAHRPEPEIVGVNMDIEQENIFSLLGLNPLLLLEPPPENDNLVIRIVRPGEDTEAVLEEARKQLANNAGRRRRRGRLRLDPFRSFGPRFGRRRRRSCPSRTLV